MRNSSLQGAAYPARPLGAGKRIKAVCQHRALYAMLVIPVAYYLVLKYAPMYGITIAFKEYNMRLGILKSPWVGLKYFEQLFQMRSFAQVFANTFIIALYKLLFNFPAPVLLALLFNELTHTRFKKIVQTISYLPHFLSWVVLASIFMTLLSPSIGPIGPLFDMLGLKKVYLVADPQYFRGLLVCTTIWKSMGWNSIIYLASLSNIDPELYEAATMDGASRLKQVIHITLPELTPVITIMLIFAVGQLISDDFDQVFNLLSPATMSVGDVLSTFTYRAGIISMNYSFATAVGFVRNIISFSLVFCTNAIAKRINEYGLW